MAFQFTKITKSLYFGFEKRRGAFIAKPEKALVDALYLTALGKYRLDCSAIDFDRLDKGACDAFLSMFPPKVSILWRRYAPYGTT